MCEEPLVWKTTLRKLITIILHGRTIFNNPRLGREVGFLFCIRDHPSDISTEPPTVQTDVFVMLIILS
jgi:hypothetical protein